MELNDKNNGLTLIEITSPKIRPNGSKRNMGLFRCDCGDESIKTIYSVKVGCIKNCMSCSRKISSKKKKTHGKTSHPLYRKWADMKKRCYNPNVDRYKNYGGLGIKVCDSWKNNFSDFYEWSIKNGWKIGLTIERDNLNKDYCPSNCRFISMKDQGFNKRNTFFVEFEGKEISLSKLLMINGKSNRYSTIWHGIKKGKSMSYYIDKYSLTK